jgi:hypothetical protein
MNSLINETVILEENYVKVSYFQSRKLVQMTWNGTFTNEEYQKAFTTALDFQVISGVPVHNFLSDIRNQGIVNPENRKWFETNGVPRAAKQGLRRGAVVFDGNVFKKYYINLIFHTTNKFQLPFKFFITPEEAYQWFDSFNE